MPARSSRLFFSQFAREFARYQKARIFLFHGDDSYQKSSGIKLLKSHFSSESTSGFDLITFYGDSCRAADLIENLEMLPFMSPHKIIILKNSDALNKSDRDLLEKYCQNPLKSSIFILTAAKIDNRTTFMKTLNSKGVVVECKKPYNAAILLRWLDSELKFRRISMDNQSRNFLVNNIELSYQAAHNELEKLYLFTGGAKSYKVSDVEATLGTSRENNIYDLQRAVGSKNLSKSQKVLNNILQSQEAASFGVMAVAMLTRYFLILWKINSYRQNNYSDHEISQNHLSEVFFSFREEYIKAAHSYTPQQLRKVFSYLLKADTDLKSININSITLFLLIYRICTV